MPQSNHKPPPQPTPPQPTPSQHLPDVEPDQFPHHIAIIMDGNGRWAVQQNKPRINGHECGAKSVRTIITHCAELGLEALSLYSFSTENWNRPPEEVNFLMELYVQYLIAERQEMLDNNIRFYQCGRLDGLPNHVREEVERTIEVTSHCTGLKLFLVLNYGSRMEITDAVRAIAEKAQKGELSVDQIDESTVADHLYVPDMPDPDLLIRTAGEMRLSNFLLWQISYAEIYISQKLWPDFSVDDLHEAIRDFARRNRRYGGVDQTNS